MKILFLGCCTPWLWVMLLTFCRYMLSSIRVTVCRLVSCCVYIYIYIALFWKGTGRGREESGDCPKWSTNPQSITLPHSSSKQNAIVYTQLANLHTGNWWWLQHVPPKCHQYHPQPNSPTTQEHILHFCYCNWLTVRLRTTSNLKQQNLYPVSVTSRLYGIPRTTFPEHGITWEY